MTSAALVRQLLTEDQSSVLLFQVANQVVQALLTQKVGCSSAGEVRLLLLTSDL